MKIYDFEFHAYSPESIDALKVNKGKKYPYYDEETDMFHSNKSGAAPVANNPGFYGGPLFNDLYDIGDNRIKHMDEVGVECGVISASPAIEYLPKEEAVEQAKLFNDWVAEACEKYPGRFKGSICLPTPYVDEAIEELERCVNELGLEYFHAHSNYGDETLADDKFIPLLEKCNELDVPIYLHPGYPTDPYLDCGMIFSSAGLGFAVDVMKTSMFMVLKGRFDQFPNLKIIIGHMGEFYPYILERLNNRFFNLPVKLEEVNCEHDFSYYFENKNIFIATGGITDPKVAMFAIDKIGIDNIVYGSDYPYELYKPSIDFVNNLPLSDEDKEKIFYKNAEKYIFRNK